MTDFHGRMMNIPDGIDPNERSDDIHADRAYAAGHRDARHAAAEIALEADAEIARLLDEIERLRRTLGAGA